MDVPALQSKRKVKSPSPIVVSKVIRVGEVVDLTPEGSLVDLDCLLSSSSLPCDWAQLSAK